MKKVEWLLHLLSTTPTPKFVSLIACAAVNMHADAEIAVMVNLPCPQKRGKSAAFGWDEGSSEDLSSIIAGFQSTVLHNRPSHTLTAITNPSMISLIVLLCVLNVGISVACTLSSVLRCSIKA